MFQQLIMNGIFGNHVFVFFFSDMDNPFCFFVSANILRDFNETTFLYSYYLPRR